MIIMELFQAVLTPATLSFITRCQGTAEHLDLICTVVSSSLQCRSASLQSKLLLISTWYTGCLQTPYNSVRVLIVIPTIRSQMCLRITAKTHKCGHTCVHTHTQCIEYPAHTGVCSVEHFEPVQHH